MFMCLYGIAHLSSTIFAGTRRFWSAIAIVWLLATVEDGLSMLIMYFRVAAVNSIDG